MLDRRVSTPVVLRNGDRISLGKRRMIFRDPTGVPRGSTPAPTGGVVTSAVEVKLKGYDAQMSALPFVNPSYFSHMNSWILERLQLQDHLVTMGRFDMHAMNFRFRFEL